MKKSFEPKLIESYWYNQWEEKGYFNAKPNSKLKPYTIMIPPPNVTGTLHMGHGFQNTLIDVLIRYKRMSGYDALWQVGTDHAGIATQMVVERQLEEKGKSKEDIGREKFEKKVWKWKDKSGNKITRQLRRLGASVDWSRETFTMDPRMSEAVQEVFIKLYEEGLIYRGKRLVNWDIDLQTALSDLEVTHTEESGFLWFFQYPVLNGDKLVIATTRPETMLGDTAVAVNPKDKRYKKFIGKKILLPISNREIPIISDDHVDSEFGSGCVKITPGHDFNDFEIGERHKLPVINILNLDGTLNNQVPKEFQGLQIKEARKKIINNMSSLGLLEKELPHITLIPRGDRSNAVLEPLITDQWFVDVKEMAKEATRMVKTDKIKFVPKRWEKTYFSWMNNIQDWCISRQLWWGHRIPAWFDENENIYVGKDEKSVRAKYKLSKEKRISQDLDVLDTWFSSALWTFSTLGWPKKNKFLKRYHPTNVLVTGFDIIFFWVARMIMMTTHFVKEIPFETIFIHGLIKDSEGQKMSKSKGNILDPLDIIDGINLQPLVKKRIEGLMQPKMKDRIEKQTKKEFPNGIKAFGTDALRFTFCSLSSRNRDINFDMKRVEGYRNFCNKLWNAARFIDLKQSEYAKTNKDHSLNSADKWIRNRLDRTIEKVESSFVEYRFDLISQSIYEFIWYEFCDWYLEITKARLSSNLYSQKEKGAILKSLIDVFERVLRMAHPLMPFITEEIWQQLRSLHKKDSESIMISKYPKSRGSPYANEEISVNWLKDVVTRIRNIRGELNIKPSHKIDVLLAKGTKQDKSKTEEFSELIKDLASLNKLNWIEGNNRKPPSAISVYKSLEILIPLEGLIDPNEERLRVKKNVAKLEKENQSLNNQLENRRFLTNAPQDLVKSQKKRVKEIVKEKRGLILHLKEVEKLT